MSVSQGDRFSGCLLGLAAGDALGTTLEFKAPGSFERLDDMVGGGPFGLKAGQWTDDTSMALCLAQSLIDCAGHDPRGQMSRYVQWWRNGYLSSTGQCFDIGNTVRGSLVRFMQDGNPLAGSTHRETAGNGSLMRLAPVPMFYARDASLAAKFSGESSRTTHGATAAVDACRLFGGLVSMALQGARKTDLLNADPCDFLSEPLCAEIAEIAAGSYRRKSPPAIAGTGYVVRSLEAALWAFNHAEDFRHGALMAVNLGDDADTTGAIYGQLAGACFGVSGIPEHWVDKIAMRKVIEAMATDLSEEDGCEGEI